MASRTSTGSIWKDGVESDGHLIEMVRSGDMSAFDVLYERHLSIASTVARRNVDNQSDSEDVVAEAFQSVLQSLVAGKGPDTFFRAYLLSTVTRLSHQRNRKAGRILPSGDDAALDQTLAESDSAVTAFESHTVSKAFRALPERWQAVLWYLDVERMKPAVVAPILGLSPNAVSALALRAREGLRRKYLQFHIADQPDSTCGEFASKLGNFVRGGLSSATERKVREHLDGCSHCTAALAELKDVQGSMRAVLLPLVTGIPLAAWTAKGAGLGVLGGVVPMKAAFAVPVFAQPAVMVIIAAAGVGLVLGAAGVFDHFSPDSYTEQRAVETGNTQPERDPLAITPAPPQTSTPSLASPTPVDPVPVAAASLAPELEPPHEQPVTSVPVPAPAVTESRAPSVDPPAPSPTSLAAPLAAPSPRSEPQPATSQVEVTGSAERNRGGDSRGAALQIDFTASGAHALWSAKAVFAVGQNGWLDEDSVRAPEGWTCSLESKNVIACATNSIRREDLHFHVRADSKRGRGDLVLTYSLNGKNIAPNQFSYSY